jgi:hypothetical protein
MSECMSYRYCPSKHHLNILRTAGAIILRISHGYEIKETNDPFIDIADEAVHQFSLSTAPGAWLVDVIPVCVSCLALFLRRIDDPH